MLPPANLAGAAESFRYRGPEGVTFIVTPAGLSSIVVKEQEVAKGDWMATDASYLLTAGATPNPLTFTNRSLEPSGPDRVRVRQIAQWLAPGVQAVAANRVDMTKLSKDFETPYRFLFRNHITPLTPDWRVKKEAAELRALTDEFLTADGKWKK